MLLTEVTFFKAIVIATLLRAVLNLQQNFKTILLFLHKVLIYVYL